VLIHAQDARQATAPSIVWPRTPFVVSGGEIGFRVIGFRDGGPETPVGNWVIRANANAPWVEPYVAGQKLVP
jgi:hypothetical protein